MITVLKGDGYEHCLRPVQEDDGAPKIEVLRYEEVLGKEPLPRTTYVFTDFDRLNTAVRSDAARLFLRLKEAGCRVLNNPAQVRTRFPLLRSLHRAGLNPINVYLADEGVSPSKYPVFIRVADDHKGSLSELLPDQATLDAAIEAAVASGVPRSEILIVEYCAQEVRPGIYRKSSVYRIADRFVRDIWWFGRFWDIKGDIDNLIEPEFYETELAELRENRFPDKVREAFRIAEIDFGRLDFGIVDGNICIYEINTHPTFFGPRKHANPARVESIRLRWSRLLDAFHAIDAKEGDGGLVETKGCSIAALEDAARLSPALRFIDLRLSREHANRGESSEAIAAARAELSKNPQSTKAIANLAELAIEQDLTDEAISLLERLAEDAPRRLITWRRLARLLRKAGRLEEGRDRLIRGLSLADGTWPAYLELAWIEKDLGEFEAALASGERALALAADGEEPWRVYVLLAWLRMDLGDHEEARAAAQNALALAPENEQVQELVRKTGLKTGRWGTDTMRPKIFIAKVIARASEFVGRK